MKRPKQNPPQKKECPGRRAPNQGDVIGTHDSTITQRAEFASLFAVVERTFASFSRLFLFAQPTVPVLVTVAAVVMGGAA